MKRYLIISLLLVLFSIKGGAQAITNSELEKRQVELKSLQLKTQYSFVGGAVFTIGGTVLTTIGGMYMSWGVEQGGSLVNPGVEDWRPAGRAMLGLGVPMAVGGVALIALGIHYRHEYVVKKKAVTLISGFLDDGNMGMDLTF